MLFFCPLIRKEFAYHWSTFILRYHPKSENYVGGNVPVGNVHLAVKAVLPVNTQQHVMFQIQKQNVQHQIGTIVQSSGEIDCCGLYTSLLGRR